MLRSSATKVNRNATSMTKILLSAPQSHSSTSPPTSLLINGKSTGINTSSSDRITTVDDKNKVVNESKHRRYGMTRIKTKCKKMYYWLFHKQKSNESSATMKTFIIHHPIQAATPKNDQMSPEIDDEYWGTMAKVAYFGLRLDSAKSEAEPDTQPDVLSPTQNSELVAPKSALASPVSICPEPFNQTPAVTSPTKEIQTMHPMDKSPINKTNNCTTVGMVSQYHQFMELFKFMSSTPSQKDASSICHVLSCIARSHPIEFSKTLGCSAPLPLVKRRKVKHWFPTDTYKKPTFKMSKRSTISPSLTSSKRPLIGEKIQGVLEKLKECADKAPKASVEIQKLEKVRSERITFHSTRQLGLQVR